jgi:hypothetical protein
MKRSEALKQIFEILELTYSHPEGNAKLAADILSKVEELGMLPPTTKATLKDFTNTGFTQEFLDEHDFTVNKWEPEDET